MFHFPEFASQGLYIQPRDDGVLPPPGFPIRKSPDHSLFGGSPKHIAAYHVLRRLLAPRHPPIALSILNRGFSTRSIPYSTFNDLAGPVAFVHHRFGGGERNRTDDLLRARQALSRLSYAP